MFCAETVLFLKVKELSECAKMGSLITDEI